MAHQGDPLEDTLEQASPRSRVHASLERAPPRSRARSPSSRLRLARGFASPSTGVRFARGRPPLACACPRTRAFNALTQAGQCHHAPGARAPVPPHQLPRREPIPITVGMDCATRPVSVP
jgi:hypothetical protein